MAATTLLLSILGLSLGLWVEVDPAHAKTKGLHTLFQTVDGHLGIEQEGHAYGMAGRGNWARFVLIEVVDWKEGQNATALAEEVRAQKDYHYVRLQNVGNPCNFLRVFHGNNGELLVDGRGNSSSEETIFGVKTETGKTRLYSHATESYLTVNEKDVGATFNASSGTIFNQYNVKFRVQEGDKIEDAYQCKTYAPHEEFNFTLEEKMFFRDNGYVIAKQAIEKEMVDDALRLINRAIQRGHHGANDHASDSALASDGFGNFDLSIRKSPEIMNLFYGTKVWGLAESLIGKNKLWIEHQAQVALRYPLPKNATKELPNDMWHVDGIDSQTGVNNFTMLIGIVLSPWKEPFCGQFVVFPKTHYQMYDDISRLGRKNFVTLYNNPRPALETEPLQLMAEPGDVVFAHPLLPHRAGPNHSANIRYAVFFRVHRPGKKSRELNFSDLFLEFDGIRELPAAS